MKLSSFSFIIIMVSCLLLRPALGVVLAYDDFEDYDLGDLEAGNNNAGDGWGDPWSANTVVTSIINPNGALSYQIPGGGLIDGGNRANEINGNSNTVFSRTLQAPVSDTIYVGFLFYAAPGTSFAKNDFAALWLGEALFVGAPSIGLKSNFGPNDEDLMGRITGNREVYGSEMNIGQTYYMVAKISKTGGMSTYNQLDLWVNPSVGDSNSPLGTSTGNIQFSEFSAVGFRSVNLNSNDRLWFDALTIATEWEDVVPIPEPSHLVLWLSILIVLFAGFDRRKSSI
ncbi:MAG: hypothetical protein AAF065_02125 [Verrucomicrobiota bacterium]